MAEITNNSDHSKSMMTYSQKALELWNQHTAKGAVDSDINSLAQDVLSQQTESHTTADEKALTAYFLTRHFDDKIPEQLKNKLRQLVTDAYQWKGLAMKVFNSLQILNRTVSDYFVMNHYDFDYFELNSLHQPFADFLFQIECEKIENDYQKRFEKQNQQNPNLLIKAYQNPQTKFYGVWMSIRGVTLDETKLPKQ